jgi:hypothetical protein
MSNSKKDKGFANTPDAILEKYRKMKSEPSNGSIGLSEKIMEISRAGVSLPYLWIDPSIIGEICVLCDSSDVCTSCDFSDFLCGGANDVFCVTSDSCDFEDAL